MSPEQSKAVMGRVIAAEWNESMIGRWNDGVDGYPASLLAVLWMTTKDEALKYIDEVCPKAWFRQIFAE